MTDITSPTWPLESCTTLPGDRPHQPDQHAEVIGVELGLALLVEAAEGRVGHLGLQVAEVVVLVDEGDDLGEGIELIALEPLGPVPSRYSWWFCTICLAASGKSLTSPSSSRP